MGHFLEGFLEWLNFMAKNGSSLLSEGGFPWDIGCPGLCRQLGEVMITTAGGIEEDRGRKDLLRELQPETHKL